MTDARHAFALPAWPWLIAAATLGCGSNRPALPGPDGTTVTGTVAYRERVTLPPDAEIRVLLADVSRQDAPARTIGETTVRPEGRQVPLPFELRFDPASVESTHTYAVRATIRSGGHMLFTTTNAYLVITQGHPMHVDLTLTLVAASATVSLWGTSWVLEDLGGAAVMDYVRATLEFPERGRVAGSGSCNRFFGSAVVTGDSLQVGQIGTTRMACADSVASQERRYLTALAGATRFALDGPSLLVYSSGLEQPLRFTGAH